MELWAEKALLAAKQDAALKSRKTVSSYKKSVELNKKEST
jgi:hypothetical protein